MKIYCGPTLAERKRLRWERKEEWHKWFAWYPVRVGPDLCVWLETLERKYTHHKWFLDFYIEYRELNVNNKGEG